MTTTPNYRARVVEIDQFWYDHRSLIDYVEVRSADDIMSTHGYSQADVQAMFAKGEHIAMDCSESFTTACRWAGLPDPNGPTYNYNGYGNTDTLFAFLDHIAVASTLDADGLMWCPPPEGLAHVTSKVSGSGSNPTVFSNGDEDGPYIYPLSDDAPAHAGQALVGLSIAKLIPVIPDPYGYKKFDSTVRQWIHNKTSERELVEQYDAFRLQPSKNKEHLENHEADLKDAATRLKTVMNKVDPDGKQYYRAWRLKQLNRRAAGQQVVK